MSTNLIVPFANGPKVTVGSNLALRQLATTDYQSGQGFQYLSDGRLFFEGVEFGGRTNLIPVITSNTVTSQKEFLDFNTNVNILNIMNVTTSNVLLNSNLVFGKSDPEIQFASGSFNIRPLTTAGVLKIYGSTNKANVWLVSNDASNGYGTDVANFSFVSVGDSVSATNKHAIGKMSVKQSEALGPTTGGGILSLTTRDPTKAATTDKGDSDEQVTMLLCNTSSTGNVISLGPGGDTDKVYVGVGIENPEYKFQVYSNYRTFLGVDTDDSRVFIGSGVSLSFDGPITISGDSADRLQIGTTGAGYQSTSLGVLAGASGAQSVAIGYEAGTYTQFANTVSVGYRAGASYQTGNAVAIGHLAGESTQGYASVAIGARAGEFTQGSYSVSVGEYAGYSAQAQNTIAVGAKAGQTSQRVGSVAIGFNAGQVSQGSYALAIGSQAGQSTQSANSIAIGSQAGQSGQGVSSVTIGSLSGQRSQGSFAIAVGESSGQIGQNTGAVSIGYKAGQSAQYANSVAIGYFSGTTLQGTNAISVGPSAGQLSQNTGAIAMGFLAGRTTQASGSVAIGYLAGNYIQKTGAVAIGQEAGKNSQGSMAVSLGNGAGSNLQSSNAIAIGYLSASNVQQVGAVAIGAYAGFASQSSQAVAIGQFAGQSLQGYSAVALGGQAGQDNQSPEAVSIGANAGQSTQGCQAIAIGSRAGLSNQAVGSVAIGYRAAETQSGNYSIAIGYSTGLGDLIPDNSIILNATGGSFAPYEPDSFTVRPVRNDSTLILGSVLSYDDGTGEIFKQGQIFTGVDGVGIGNTSSTQLLSVGNKTYFTDTGTSSIITTSNIEASAYIGYGGYLSNITGATTAGTYGQGGKNPVIQVDSSGRIVSITDVFSTYTGTLAQVCDTGNTTSNTIQFTNSGISFLTSGKVGISNTTPNTDNILSVGNKTYLTDTGLNTIVTTGNVSANFYNGNAWFMKSTTRVPQGSYGSRTLVPQITVDSDGRIISIVPLSVQANITLNQALLLPGGNLTTQSISFNGPTAFMTLGNVGIGNTSPLNLVSIGANTYFTEFGSNTLVTSGNISTAVISSSSVLSTGNVGVGNTTPFNLLSIGSRSVFNDTGSNTGLVTTGNVTANYYYGSALFMSNVTGATTAATYGSSSNMPQIVVNSSGQINSITSAPVVLTLDQVVGYGRTTANIISLSNAGGSSLVTTGNVGIGNTVPTNLLSVGTHSVFNETGSNTGLVTTGNVTANYYYGSALFMSNITGATTAATYGASSNMPQIVVNSSGQINSITSAPVVLTLDQVVGYGRTTANIISLSNTGGSCLVTTGRVGIGNTVPTNLLSVGTHSVFNETGSNTGMLTTGNVTANYYYGSALFMSNVTGATTAATYGVTSDMPRIVVNSSGQINSITSTPVVLTLDQVVGYGRTTANIISLSNTGGSCLVTTGNVGVGNTVPLNLLSIGTRSVFNETGSNTGLVTTGNVTANYYYGSALFMSNVTGATTAATYGSSSNMPQIVVNSSGQISSITSAPVVLTLDQVVGYGRTTANIISLSNTGGSSLVTTGRVGIGNTVPTNLLSIGTNSVFNDTGSNTGLVTTGNVTANYYYGSALFMSNVTGSTTAATYGSSSNMPQIVVNSSGQINSITSTPVVLTLDQVVGYGRTTANIISLSNTGGSSLVTTGNVGIGNTVPLNLLSIGTQSVFNEFGSNTGLVTTGNVTANYYYGSAFFMSNIVGSTTSAGSYGSTSRIPIISVDGSARITNISDTLLRLTLDQVVNFGNTSANTLLLTNASNCLITTGNVAIGNAFGTSNTLTVGSNLWVTDTGSNVLFVNGNIFTTSLKTTGNVGIGNVVPSNLLCIGTSTYFTDNKQSNVMVTLGNIAANFYYGNAWNLVSTTSAVPATYGSGIAVPQIVVDANGRISSISSIPLGQGGQNLSQVVDTGNVTANTILFTNVSNALVATGNVVAANFRLTSTSVQLGLASGTVGQNTSAISIGSFAGQSGQFSNTMAVGLYAGQFNQQSFAVALGQFAGQSTQTVGAIAIGTQAGQSIQNAYAIAIGSQAGQGLQNAYSISVGQAAGQTLQNAYAIAIGTSAGNQSQGFYALSIGNQAGQGKQGSSSIALGNFAGYQSQASNAIAIGSYTGHAGQNAYSISIGDLAGQSGQYQKAVAIGQLAGQLTQQSYGVAIGLQAGQLTQNTAAVAIGSAAGTSGQRSSAVAIGDTAGNANQGSSAVAIGNRAGQTVQGSSAVAIGDRAGQTNQGNNSIAIGNQAGSSTAGSIMLNAGGTAKNTAVAGFHVFPVRTNTTSGSVLEYDTTTGEIYYNNTTLNSNYFYIGANVGGAAPTAGSISTGTKLLLWNDGSGYAIGIEGNFMWFNVIPAAGYKWYVNASQKMILNTSGNLTTAGYITNGSLYMTGSTISKTSGTGAGDYILYGDSGSTDVNAPTGAYVGLRINNIDKFTVSGTEAYATTQLRSPIVTNGTFYLTGNYISRTTGTGAGDYRIFIGSGTNYDMVLNCGGTLWFRYNDDTRMTINSYETYVFGTLRTPNISIDQTATAGIYMASRYFGGQGVNIFTSYGVTYFTNDGSATSFGISGGRLELASGGRIYGNQITRGTAGADDWPNAVMYWGDTSLTLYAQTSGNINLRINNVLKFSVQNSITYCIPPFDCDGYISTDSYLNLNGIGYGYAYRIGNYGGSIFFTSDNGNYDSHYFTREGPAARRDSVSTWNGWSDRNLKTDIVNANLDTCYENIKNLSLKRYRFKDEVTMINKTDANRLGFIAQDIQLVFPKSVTEEKADKEGTKTFLTLNLDQLNYALYGAVQRIMEKIEYQKRGSVVLVNGVATVTIDSSKFGENPQLFLQPQMTFDRVMGEIVGDQINIICENSQSVATVNWLIVSG
jgi:hypothetical protein